MTSAGRSDMKETNKASYRIEDGIDRCLRAAAATADILNREMERASKQKRIQENGYEMKPGTRDTKKKKTKGNDSDSTSKSITMTRSEISDSIIFGRPKKKMMENKQKGPTPATEKKLLPRGHCSLPAVLVGHRTPSISDVTRKVRADHSKTLLAKQKKTKEEQKKEAISSNDISIPSLPMSNTLSTYSNASPLNDMRCLSLKETSLPCQGDQPLGSQDFPLLIIENGARLNCTGRMEIHRRQNSDWLLLSMTVKGSRGDCLLNLRCELLGGSVRNVVVNGQCRPPFQKQDPRRGEGWFKCQRQRTRPD